MTKYFSFRLLSLFVFVALMGGMFSCEEIFSPGPEKCGTLELKGNSFSQGEAMSEASYSYLGYAGTTAEVEWDLECKNVCTAEHAQLECNMWVDKDAPITVKASVWYGVLHEPTLNLSKVLDGTTYKYEGSHSLGMKDVYGDEPGMFILSLTVSFPSSGDRALDEAFVNNNVIYASLSAEYNEPK